jgi:hypothetical protein
MRESETNSSFEPSQAHEVCVSLSLSLSLCLRLRLLLCLCPPTLFLFNWALFFLILPADRTLKLSIPSVLVKILSHSQ